MITKEPSFAREMTKVIRVAAIALVGIAIPFTSLSFLAKTHPFIAISLLYASVIVMMIVACAYQSYRWKKEGWEWKKGRDDLHRPR
jgi:hypothetical protein